MWTRVRARVCLWGGAAFAGSSIHDGKDEKKWVFRIPILADLGGQVPVALAGPRISRYVRARVRVRACACVRARACVRACVHSILNRPLLGAFVLQTVKDVFGNEVRGLHSTYNNQIKEQVPRPRPRPRPTRLHGSMLRDARRRRFWSAGPGLQSGHRF